MGYKKYATKNEMLEANRDYIIEEFSGAHGSARSASSIAREMGVSLRLLRSKMAKWEGEGALEFRSPGRLEEDREVITSLYNGGMPVRELCEKFSCSRNTMRDSLARWGIFERKDIESSGGLPKISLNDFKIQWAVITEETIVTVGRIPRFRVTPIGREDK